MEFGRLERCSFGLGGAGLGVGDLSQNHEPPAGLSPNKATSTEWFPFQITAENDTLETD